MHLDAKFVLWRQGVVDSRPGPELGLNGRWVPSGSTSAMCRYADRAGFWPLNVSFLI